MEDMCRVCLKSKKDCPNSSQFISLFTSIGDQDKIFQKIMKCATVKIKRTDEFPKYICQECFNNLETAYNFKVQCETSNQTLQDFLIAEAITEINGDSSDTNGLIEEESSMVRRKRGRPKKLKKEKNVFVEGFCQKTASTKCLEPSIEEDNELTVKLEDDFVYNSFDEDIVTEEIIPEAKRGRGRPKKIYGSGQHLAAKPMYVCDQCGKSFKLMESLKGHQRRHTGEKPFTCSTCGKSFHVINELKKHSNTHTGTKPYSCKYCERRFTDWGSRFKHERCHRGERPYQCEMCPKTFSYSHVLNRHKLTHSGNKAFSCELCKKQFTLKYHLTNHNRKYHNEGKPPEKPIADQKIPSQIVIEDPVIIIEKHTECFMENPTETDQLIEANNDKDISFAQEEPQILTIATSDIYQAREINCYKVVKIEKLDMGEEFVKSKIKMY